MRRLPAIESELHQAMRRRRGSLHSGGFVVLTVPQRHPVRRDDVQLTARRQPISAGKRPPLPMLRPNDAAQRQMLVDLHWQAVGGDRSSAAGLAMHEAGHAIVGAHDGMDVVRIVLEYDPAHLQVDGARCEVRGRVTSAFAVAGGVAASICSFVRGTAMSPGDWRLLDETLQGASDRVVAYREAQKRAEQTLRRHQVTLWAVWERLFTTGLVQDQELSMLLAPARRWLAAA